MLSACRSSWNDQVVGVLNVQTEQPRDFTPGDVAQLGAIADLLAGIVEKGRRQIEAEARRRRAAPDRRGPRRADRARHPRAPDAARRRPGLHGAARRRPAARGPRLARPRPARPARRLARRRARPGRAPRPPRRLDPRSRSGSCPDVPAEVVPTDVAEADRRGRRVDRAARPPAQPRHPARRPAPRARRPAAPPPDPRAPHRERREVRAARDDDHDRPPLVEGWVRIGVTDQGPGVPEEWRERIFEPYARRDTHTARGSGIGLYAAKRLGESMGARLWCEPADPTGARFVVSLPAAAAV